MSALFRLPTDYRATTTVIRSDFEFERMPVAFGDRVVDAYGKAVVLGDSTTWWVEAEIDGVRLSWIHPNTPLFARLNIGLHRQFGEQIAERMNRAVEDQGGYPALFGEAMPANPIQRGRRRVHAFDDVYDVAA